MRTFLLSLALLTACSSNDPGAPIAGTYLGQLAVQHTDPSHAVFATLDLRIDDDGNVAGSRATTKSPTDPIGEIGTLTGTMNAIDDLSVETAWQLDFPTVGRFTLSGTLIYSGTTRGLAGNLSTRDAALAYVGNTAVTVQQ